MCFLSGFTNNELSTNLIQTHLKALNIISNFFGPHLECPFITFVHNIVSSFFIWQEVNAKAWSECCFWAIKHLETGERGGGKRTRKNCFEAEAPEKYNIEVLLYLLFVQGWKRWSIFFIESDIVFILSYGMVWRNSFYRHKSISIVFVF